jgi:uncharacterized protein (TIGR02147 family)
MANVFDYFDYRKFLAEVYREQRAKRPFFSYRYFAGKIGMDAGNLVNVLQGRRHLSAAAIEPVVQFLQCTPRESKYFRTLVAYNKARKEGDIAKYFKKLCDFKDVDATKLPADSYEFYQQWHHTAILALLYMYDFDGDDEALGALLTPRISAKKAKESIALLKRLDLIKKDADDFYRPARSLLTTGEKWHATAIRDYQEQTIRLAQEALRTCSRKQRDISTLTLTLSAEELEDIKAMAREFRNEALRISKESEKPDRVYQVNIHLFPLTKKI